MDAPDLMLSTAHAHNARQEEAVALEAVAEREALARHRTAARLKRKMKIQVYTNVSKRLKSLWPSRIKCLAFKQSTVKVGWIHISFYNCINYF